MRSSLLYVLLVQQLSENIKVEPPAKLFGAIARYTVDIDFNNITLTGVSTIAGK